MKKKNWFGLVLSFAAPCKGKLILSTCLQITSVAAGLIPYLAVYRIIQMFFNETASTKGVFLWDWSMPSWIRLNVDFSWDFNHAFS